MNQVSRVPGRASTRARILDAAEDVVLTDGVANLTLEKTADRAGLSKGGVLYHFPSRSALIAAMVERLAGQFDEGLRAQHTGSGPGALVRAYIAECFAPPQGEREQRGEQLGAALIAAVASEPQLLAPLQGAFAGWQQQIADDGIDPARATVARLAADGLWLCELFGLDGLTPQLREQVRLELDRMARPETEPDRTTRPETEPDRTTRPGQE
ncbi:MAG: TetR/AcrR family transcriptional regulator [Kineosporiaceae bacterium]